MTRTLPHKVLLLGSGALKIGEAGEFDYSGSQCLKALEEEGIYTIVVNPEHRDVADRPAPARAGLLPAPRPRVRRTDPDRRTAGRDPPLLRRPDGAQSAASQLAEKGALRTAGTRVSSARPLCGIRATEDRAKFVRMMAKARVPTLPSQAVYSLEEAREAVKVLGFPVMVRVAYTLGGRAAASPGTERSSERSSARGLRASPVGQVLLERYVGAFKQIEYEVVRDARGNALTVCNMENVLCMRVHTGDNIVIAPSQTLTD